MPESMLIVRKMGMWRTEHICIILHRIFTIFLVAFNIRQLLIGIVCILSSYFNIIFIEEFYIVKDKYKNIFKGKLEKRRKR